MRPDRLALVAAAAVALWPGVALAHTAFAALGGFWAGVLHPLTAPDEIAGLLALALWARLQDRRRDLALLAALTCGCLVGAAAIGASGTRFPGETASAALMLVAGLAGALRLAVGGGLQMALFAIGGTILGGAAGDGTRDIALAAFAPGVAVASAAVVSYALIATARAEAAWTQIALRAGASWIAAIGLMLAALASRQLVGSA